MSRKIHCDWCDKNENLPGRGKGYFREPDLKGWVPVNDLPVMTADGIRPLNGWGDLDSLCFRIYVSCRDVVESGGKVDWADVIGRRQRKETIELPVRSIS